MGGKSRSPDYGAAAIAQGEANKDVVRDQTYANRPDQFTPWGNTQWTSESVIDPATGEPTTAWQQTQTLTPELQSILDKQVSMQGARTDLAGLLTGRMGAEFGTPMDWRGLSPMGQVPTAQFTLPEDMQRSLDYSNAPAVGDPLALRQRAEDAVYQKGMSRLQPEFDSKRQQMEVKLRNQGIGPEDAAWQAQMGALDRQETDAKGQLQMDAVGAGLGEQAQLFGQGTTLRNMATGEADRQANFFNTAAGQAFGQAQAANQQNFGQAMSASNYANQLRQQQLTEAMQRRGFSLNEMNALLSGQQVNTPQMPNFSQASAAQAAPIYQGAVDQGNFNQMGNQALFSGLGGLASTAITGGFF